MSAALERVVVVDADGPGLEIVEGAGSATAVIWPGMGARLRSMHRISLGAGAATVEMTHPSDAVYYVISGGGRASDPDAGEQDLVEGSMVHVDAGTSYRLIAGSGGMELVGGPAPGDPSLYAVLTSDRGAG
jgi:mannose-6-phosphate isomerase-like protein (cupin superfamily)